MMLTQWEGSRVDTSEVSMSELLGKFFATFDAYSRVAHLGPVVLLLPAPVAVAVGAGVTGPTLSEVSDWPLAFVLLGVTVILGLPVAAAQWVRMRGKRLQDEHLWPAWGGNPVEASLCSDGVVATRRRKVLAESTGLPVDDLAHPERAELMDNAVGQLISRTRVGWPRVFDELRWYGLARNLLGIRKVGIGVSTVSLLAGLVLAVVAGTGGLDGVTVPPLAAGTVVAAAALMAWYFFPSEQRVRVAARDYRRRLLEALDAGAMSP